MLREWDGTIVEETIDGSYALGVLMNLLYRSGSGPVIEFRLLKYVDEYELVRFNARQMLDLIADLELLKSLVPDGRHHDEKVSTIDRLIRLAARCHEANGGLFLDFIGD